jgi:hypothetical protein
MKKFSFHGTETGSQTSRRLDEIVICGSPDTIRDIGLFLITAAYDLSKHETDHIHLQDMIKGFSYKKHTDVIAIQSPVQTCIGSR